MAWVIAGLALLAVPTEMSASDTQTEMESLTEHLHLFPTSDFVYDRELTFVGPMPEKWIKGWGHIAKEIRTRDYPAQELIKLLKHQSAGVRTLALAALFAREEMAAFPHIAALRDDDAPTAPTPNLRIAVALGHEIKKPLLAGQTVGDVAEAMIRTWLDCANGYRPLEADAYWADHKDHPHCLSLMHLRYCRATQLISPFRKKRIPKLEALRNDIEKLPANDKAWTLLWLGAHYSHPDSWRAAQHLVSKKEMIQLAKTLGPGLLMRYMKGQPISQDPDLSPGERGMERHSLSQWIWKRSDQILRPQDAKLALELERKHGSPWFAIGQAQLQPKNAKAILHQAMKRLASPYGWDRAEIVAARLRIVGESEIPFAANWFFEQQPERTGTSAAEVFTSRLGEEKPPAARKFLHAVIGDKKFDRLNQESLRILIQLVWKLDDKTLAPFSELYQRVDVTSKKDQQRLARWREALRKWRQSD